MPAAAVRVPPVHVVDALGVGATTSPAGRLSVKAKLDAASALAELSMVKVRVLMPPAAMGSGENAFAKVGGGSTDEVGGSGVGDK